MRKINIILRIDLQLRLEGVLVAGFGLFEVDDIPDSGKVLRQIIRTLISRKNSSTYVDLDVLVLEIEGMLPDVDTDDGDVSQKRVLVGGGRDLKSLGDGVDTLCRT